MEFDFKDLVIAFSSAGFTLFITWFGSYLSSASENRKAKAQRIQQLNSIETEMADIVSTVLQIQNLAEVTMFESVKEETVQWLFAPPLETPVFTELFKIAHTNFEEVKRRNVRTFYSMVHEINGITQRCRSYLQAMERDPRAFVHYNALLGWCNQLLVLHRHIGAPDYPKDAEYYTMKDRTDTLYKRVLEMQFGPEN
tara:strand:- start:23 stop:613 length:591 start_codon:yes stop_codon:yes gene_type:complete